MFKIFAYTTAVALALSPMVASATGELTGEMTHKKAKTPEQHAKASKAPKAEVAKGVSLTIGGVMNFQAGMGTQDSAFETGSFSREYHFANDTEIHFLAEGAASNGLKYGAVIELEADVNADNRGEGTNSDKTYLWTESNIGRVEMGNNAGAEATMAVNAASIARGTGGIDGDFEFYANTSGATFIITPDLPSANTGGATEDSTKVSYYTPRVNGIQAGLSFTPDSGDSGTASGFTSDSNGDNENVFSPGINYQNEYSNGMKVDAALVGEFGSSETAATEDLAAWQFGAAVGYNGFSVAASYADWDDSNQAAGSNDDASHWTAGVAYETGALGVSLTYLESENADNGFNNLVLSADYELAQGLVPYIEVGMFEADEDGTTVDNDGTVVLVGSTLSF